MFPSTKAEALARGERTYYTGVPCKDGHVELRAVSTGVCLACQRSPKEKKKRAERYRIWRPAKPTMKLTPMQWVELECEEVLLEDELLKLIH